MKKKRRRSLRIFYNDCKDELLKFLTALSLVNKVILGAMLLLIVLVVFVSKVDPQNIEEPNLKWFAQGLSTIGQSGLVVALSLLLAIVAFVESVRLSHEMKHVFGFNEYIKKSLIIYRNAGEWLFAILANWEIDDRIADVLSKLGSTKIYFCCRLRDNNIPDIDIGKLGSLDKLTGALWRYGLLLNKQNKLPDNIVFTTPQNDIDPVRMCCNNLGEALISSSPASEGKDVYGFYHNDPKVASYVRHSFCSVANCDNGKIDTDAAERSRIRSCFDKGVKEILEQLKTNHPIDYCFHILQHLCLRRDIEVPGNVQDAKSLLSSLSNTAKKDWEHIEKALKSLGFYNEQEFN